MACEHRRHPSFLSLSWAGTVATGVLLHSHEDSSRTVRYASRETRASRLDETHAGTPLSGAVP